MNLHYRRRSFSRMVVTMPIKKRRRYADSLQECWNQINVLTKKIDTLHRECRHDRDKIARIRGMGAALAALTEMVDDFDREFRIFPASEIYRDASGITYQSVRFCDLERISDK